MDIISANITSLSDSARQWLSEQTAEIILIQEHRALTLREFGKIPGYDVIFSPARRTMCSDRWWETSGVVAILYRTQTFHLVRDKGIQNKGHNWASLRIKLESRKN